MLFIPQKFGGGHTTTVTNPVRVSSAVRHINSGLCTFGFDRHPVTARVQVDEEILEGDAQPQHGNTGIGYRVLRVAVE